MTPIFTGYFASLGLKPENLVFSDYTSEQLYKEGAKRGAIDPCFPSKLGIPHVHNLLYVRPRQEAARHHLLPDDRLPHQRPARTSRRSRSCPTVAATPEAVKAAFTKEGDLFTEKGVKFLDTFVNLSEARTVRAADVRGVQGHPGPVAGREPARRQRRLSGARSFQQCHHARRGARGAGRSGTRRPPRRRRCWAAPTTTIRA